MASSVWAPGRVAAACGCSFLTTLSAHSPASARSPSLAVQALLATTAWPHNRALCGTKPLTSPSACQYNQRLFFALNLARHLLPLAVGPMEPPGNNDECMAIMLFCQACY